MTRNQAALAQVNEKFADMTAEIELLRSVAQTGRQVIVARAMILTREEEATFWPVYNDYRAEIAKVSNQPVKLITDYAAQRDTLTDARARTLLNDHIRLEQDFLKVRKRFIGKFDLLQKLGLAR